MLLDFKIPIAILFMMQEIVTRNTLYYKDYWFKGKPMLVNIGATFNYFTKYKLVA